jgi:transcriptional regulator with XRE-family HTH domain
LRLGFAIQRWSGTLRKPTDPIDKHVGTRVRMRRLMLGVSQTKLADALGLTFQQVQKYEKGVNRISASKLQQISEFLQAPIPLFFEGLPGPSNKPGKKDGTLLPSDVFQFVATSDGLSLAKSFAYIKSPQLRRSIVSLVESLPSKASR